MTTFFDILAGLCLLGVIVTFAMEVRLTRTLSKRARRHESVGQDDRTLRGLVRWSTVGAILAIGFLGFGYLGDTFNVFATSGGAE